MEEQKVMLTDARGNQILDIISIPESDILNQVNPFTHCLVVIKVGLGYLVGWNGYRKRWEIFGGCIEQGETPRDYIGCIC